MAMFEIVMRNIGSSFFEIRKDCLRAEDRKVPQVKSTTFPKLEKGCLGQIFHQCTGTVAPSGCDPHNDEAHWVSNPGNELTPRLVVTRSGTETYDLRQ